MSPELTEIKDALQRVTASEPSLPGARPLANRLIGVDRVLDERKYDHANSEILALVRYLDRIAAASFNMRRNHRRGRQNPLFVGEIGKLLPAIRASVDELEALMVDLMGVVEVPLVDADAVSSEDGGAFHDSSSLVGVAREVSTPSCLVCTCQPTKGDLPSGGESDERP